MARGADKKTAENTADDQLANREFKVVGTRPARPDGADKVTGRARLVRMLSCRANWLVKFQWVFWYRSAKHFQHTCLTIKVNTGSIYLAF